MTDPVAPELFDDDYLHFYSDGLAARTETDVELILRLLEPALGAELVDLRELAYTARFDVVINWFTSFGYFDDAGNQRTLENFRRALRPGGKLLIEQHNRDAVVRRLAPEFAGVTEKGDDLMVDRVTRPVSGGD